MSRTIGQHTVSELFLMVDDLEHRVEELRREQLATLLGEVTRLAELVSNELAADQKALGRAQVQFRKDFGLASRLNPFGRKRRDQAWKRSVGRHEREVHGDRTLHARLFALLTVVSGATEPVEWRQHPGAIAAVYDGTTGRVEWRSRDSGGVAGVFNPLERRTEWRESDGAIYGVFNQRDNVVEWREHAGGGVCGVFNPITGAVEWQQEDGAGVFGVFNSETRSVRWRSIPHASPAAGWDHTMARWEWRDHRSGGIACVYHDGVTYQTSSSWYPTSG